MELRASGGLGLLRRAARGGGERYGEPGDYESDQQSERASPGQGLSLLEMASTNNRRCSPSHPRGILPPGTAGVKPNRSAAGLVCSAPTTAARFTPRCAGRLDGASYAPRDGLGDGRRTRRSSRPDRAWWLRVPAVLVSPRPVFFALREDDPDDVAARSEPVLLLVWLAGMAAVLATPTAGALLDKPEYDALLVAVWAFIAGGIYGAVGYFLFGFALFFGARLFGSLGSFRRERQLVGFALAPLALSLLVLLPVRLALYGGDTFREGGADEGTGETVLLAAPARLRRLVARPARASA